MTKLNLLEKGVVIEPQIIYSLENLVVIKYMNGYQGKEKGALSYLSQEDEIRRDEWKPQGS